MSLSLFNILYLLINNFFAPVYANSGKEYDNSTAKTIINIKLNNLAMKFTYFIIENIFSANEKAHNNKPRELQGYRAVSFQDIY